MNPRTRLISLLSFALAAPLASQAQPDPDMRTLDEVVVTVQNRAQEKREVPLSLTALTHERLDAMRVRNAGDAVMAVPNTLLSESNGVNTFTVRGVGGGGRNIGFDPRVGVYIDGVYIGQSQALTMPWLDLEQAVFLRGPQGHLFGRNSVAGAVVLTTRPAEGPANASVRATVGSYGRREATITAGAPLTDTLSGRVAVSRERSDGFVTNRVDGARWGGVDRSTGRVQLGWTPTEDWRVNLSVVASDSHQDVPYGQPITDFFDTPLPSGALPPHEVAFNVTPYVRLRTEGATATAVRSLGNGGDITAVVASRRVKQRRGLGAVAPPGAWVGATLGVPAFR